MARYQDAIDWLAWNDDTSFMDDSERGYGLSVTASLIADLWNKTEEELRADLRKALKRYERERNKT